VRELARELALAASSCRIRAMVVESRPARDGEPLCGGRGTVGRGSGKASASARSGSDPRRGTARGGAAGEGRGGGAAQRGTARGGVAGEG